MERLIDWCCHKGETNGGDATVKCDLRGLHVGPDLSGAHVSSSKVSDRHQWEGSAFVPGHEIVSLGL